MIEERKQLSVGLFNAGVFKFGKFYSTGGCELDSWFDLLVLFGYPSLMDKICEHAAKFITEKNLKFHSVCGTSYAGIPFAFLLASKLHKPSLIWSKEVCYRSTDSRIRGKISENEYCIVIEEVLCSGNSTLKVIKDIEDSGMLVKDIYTIIDLEQGAIENFEKFGYKVYSLMKMSEFVNILCDENLITTKRRDNIISGFSDKFAVNGDCITNTNLGNRKLVQYEKRIDSCKSKIGQKLFKLMLEKKSNLCVEFFDQSIDTVLQVAELIGPYICILSIHLNTLENVDEFKLNKLVKISRNHNFLIMDDCKLSEDGNVLIEQCRQRFKFADLLTAYTISGENMLLSLKHIINNEFLEKGIFVVASPNICDAVIGPNYEKASINMTTKLFEEVTGFISSKNGNIPLGYIHMCSDFKTSSGVVKPSCNSFYSSKVIVSDICADVVKLYYDKRENIEKVMEKEQLSLWDAYLKRSDESSDAF